MTSAGTNDTNWMDDDTLQAVRPEVRRVLESSQAFRKLTAAEQKQLALATVRVAAYMSNPDGLAKQELSPEGGVLAQSQSDGQSQADGVEDVKTRLGKAPGFAGKDFQAAGVAAGTKQFGELVKKVDFPKFVSGLIQNVFQAIVDSSLQQMRAYGELIANVAKTVDQFAQDNISENNARDWLAQRYPDSLDVDTSAMSTSFADGDTAAPATPRLTGKGDNVEAQLKNISDDVQLAKPVTDISDEAEERRLVMAARLQIARGRQQLLASMVMLGINRIVVTDGLIHAKVVFDMRASDTAQRVARASLFDKREDTSSTQLNASYGGWFSPVNASLSSESTSDHVTTVESSVDESSESKAQVKANLTGEVRVNFKSDYLPMEKMASPQMIAAIQGNAVPPDKPTPGPK